MSVHRFAGSHLPHLIPALVAFGWLPSSVGSNVLRCISRDLFIRAMPAIAQQAIARSPTNPILDLLSSTRTSHYSENQTMPLPPYPTVQWSKVESGKRIALECARAIVNREVTPVCGATVLSRIAWDCEELVVDLGIFIGRVDEWGYLIDQRSRLSNMLVSDAQEFVNRLMVNTIEGPDTSQA